MASALALTFDDGPHPGGTRGVLGALREHGAHATFFIWGQRAAIYPDLVREILADGHSVQPHCWRHISHRELDPCSIRADLDAVMALLASLGAPESRLWRPPYGHLRRGATRAIAAERGLALVGWTVDPRDFEGTPAPRMRDQIAAIAAGRESPVVVLLHDGHREHGRPLRRVDPANTCALVRILLAHDARRLVSVAGAIAAGLAEWPPAAPPS